MKKKRRFLRVAIDNNDFIDKFNETYPIGSIMEIDENFHCYQPDNKFVNYWLVHPEYLKSKDFKELP